MTLLRRAFGFSPDSEGGKKRTMIPPSPHMPPEIPGRHSRRVKRLWLPVRQRFMPAVAAATAVETADNAALPAALFDAVIEVFNSAQPDFIKSVSTPKPSANF